MSSVELEGNYTCIPFFLLSTTMSRISTLFLIVSTILLMNLIEFILGLNIYRVLEQANDMVEQFLKEHFGGDEVILSATGLICLLDIQSK